MRADLDTHTFVGALLIVIIFNLLLTLLGSLGLGVGEAAYLSLVLLAGLSHVLLTYLRRKRGS